MSRDEPVVVGDFVATVQGVARWLPSDHPLFGKSAGDVLSALMTTYLKPCPDVAEAVAAFRREHLGQGATLAVHVRGLDKLPDAPDIESINQETLTAAEAWMSEHRQERLLLITDSAKTVEVYRARFGERLVTTDALRLENERAALYLRRDVGLKRRALLDVMTDTYLASSCEAFIGNGWSNVSVAVWALKSWPPGRVRLLGGNVAFEEFLSLFQAQEDNPAHDRFALAKEHS